MKRFPLRSLLCVLTAFLLMVVWPVVREIRQERKDRALIDAVKQTDAPAVVGLLDDGANANSRETPKDTRPARNASGETALFMAARGGQVPIVQFLLARHANITIKDINGDSALDIVMRCMDRRDGDSLVQVLHLLRQAGAR